MLLFITLREPYIRQAFGQDVLKPTLRLPALRHMVGRQVTRENGSQYGDLCLNILRDVGPKSNAHARRSVEAVNARSKTWTVLISVSAVVNCDLFICFQ